MSQLCYFFINLIHERRIPQSSVHRCINSVTIRSQNAAFDARNFITESQTPTFRSELKLVMKVITLIVIGSLAFSTVKGQQAGNQKPENHPPLPIQTCTKSGGCQTVQKNVVIDANWRWLHNTGGYTNCYTGTNWNTNYCPDGPTCARNCALDGADYPNDYGITTNGNALRINFVTKNQFATNVGARLYLLDSETEYMMFKLKNMEFTFDVDVSMLPCGTNGALYFIEMDGDGGMSKYPGNNAGAKFGTGYCDAQCPHDIKYINGEANCEKWDSTLAIGRYGTCCTEMDIWESNSISTAYTPHVCTVQGQTRCEGADCGDTAAGQRHTGVCDKDGCDFNPYRLGDKTFFGPGANFTIDTTNKFTVVTQFVTSDGTANGDLTDVRRIWVQNGKVIQSNAVTVGGKQYNSITDDFCNAQKEEFQDPNDYEKRGGHKSLGQALDKGMVLALSLWDDHAVNMLWLDSNYPPNKPATTPGVARGTCSINSGKPADVEKEHPDAYVIYSNIKIGEIGSTYNPM